MSPTTCSLFFLYADIWKPLLCPQSDKLIRLRLSTLDISWLTVSGIHDSSFCWVTFSYFNRIMSFCFFFWEVATVNFYIKHIAFDRKNLEFITQFVRIDRMPYEMPSSCHCDLSILKQ